MGKKKDKKLQQKIEKMIDERLANRQRERVYYNNPRHSMGFKKKTSQIVLGSPEEANLVLKRLKEILEQYELVSMADLYDLVGLPTTYLDNKWGWSNLDGLEIRAVKEGYLLDFPELKPIG